MMGRSDGDREGRGEQRCEGWVIAMMAVRWVLERKGGLNFDTEENIQFAVRSCRFSTPKKRLVGLEFRG